MIIKTYIWLQLNTLYQKEINILDAGITGDYTPVSGGGVTHLIYDLTDQNVRIYVNSKYLHNNLYLSENELINYISLF